MSRYIITISTEAYKPLHATEKTWENGTINDFMAALNGYKVTETNLKLVYRRIKLLCGRKYPESYETVREFFDWIDDPKNKARITYHDKICNCTRTSDVAVYGMPQGYLNIDKVIDTLRTKGEVKIMFSDLYDVRQSGSKRFKGCYMKIVKK